jgi:hypothetical protein
MRLEEQVRFGDCNASVVIIGSNSKSIDKGGRLIKEHTYATDHQSLVKRLYSLRAFPPHSSIIYRREAVTKMGGFNARIVASEDYDLWLRLAESGKIASIAKPLVKIRKHERNISDAEGGHLQTRHAIAALACHYLRVNGFLDPSTNSDEATWREFVAWVDRRSAEEGVFARYKVRADARAEYFAAENRLAGTLRFCTRLFQSGHAGALVWDKMFGSSLPRRLAWEWMRRPGAAP